MKTVTRVPTPAKIIRRLKRAFQRLGAGQATATALVQRVHLFDKAYELLAMLEMLKNLRTHCRARFVLVQGHRVMFRTKGGPINSHYAHIEMSIGGFPAGEIWTDIECQSLSAVSSGISVRWPTYAAAHELDVVLVSVGVQGYPSPQHVLIAVEAKHRMYNKALLKELLGVRRETSFKSNMVSNDYAWWTSNGEIPCNPPVGLVAYCSSSNIQSYGTPSQDFWGIDMKYLPA